VGVDKVFKALASTPRRRLLDTLRAQNGQTLGELRTHLDMTRQAVTQHLNIHDLVRLASAASLPLDDHRRDVLAKINAYALAGRSPDALPATVTPTDARDHLADASEVFDWLMTQLPG
jgi:DNA-binding transcriptional ArsR family regulator